jgi:hypothetical protein
MATATDLRELQKKLLKKLGVTSKKEGIAKTREAIKNTKGKLRETFVMTEKILQMELPD